MAQCKLTPREFISNTFSPQVATVCSPTAETVCQKNNLSFVELLQPFCKLNTEGHIKDPQGNNVTVRNLRLSIQDVNVRPPETALAKKMLNDAVSTVLCERTTSVQVGASSLTIPVSVPWFESWRETFLSVQFPSDHEFTKHFIACMVVVATSEDSPLEKIQFIGAQLHQSIPGKLPKWFNNNTLRYYILIHDSLQDDKNKAETVFSEMKNIYGANNCFLLQMNSRPPGQFDDNPHLPDPWSQFLVKKAEQLSGNSDKSNSPRTPADIGIVSSMPSALTTESDKTSQAGTPVMPQNCTLLSPDVADAVSITSETSEIANMHHLEIGQEAVTVTIHPLSPDSERGQTFNSSVHMKNQTINSPINANVWADSPNYLVAQHGARLSTQDRDRLRSLITEFCLKSLLPYVEKQIGLLNDVISNKKGVSKSLFSATKRWFGTNKPGAPGSAPSNAVIYTAESPELQLRRLGDICFMFGHYSLAYQAYHSAKRDFAADQAWLYYAGALEMAALSAFMQGEMNRKTIEYMDDAILAYSNSCRMPQFATRATLLSAECLKGRGLYGDAAKQLIRMTSEDSDLRSALLLEQAAYCFIGPKMTRKYAFHTVLAGYRYSKAGQRKHSLRCYQQAYQVYHNRGWSLAEDHIHFTIGRQAALLKQVQEAVKAFEQLLSVSSKQPAREQAAFLREFLHTHNLLLQENQSDLKELPILPLPLIDANNIKVLFGPIAKGDDNNIPASHVSFNNEECDDAKWAKLEEILIAEAQGTAPMIFKPTIALYSKTSNNTLKPNAVLNEPVHFSIELQNPLQIPLPLSNLTLLWLFNRDDKVIINESALNDSSAVIDCKVIERVILQSMSRQNIILSLIPNQVGELKILGLSYSLSNPSHASADTPVLNPAININGKRLFYIKGQKLKNIKEKQGQKFYDTDYRLEMNIVEQAPFMQIFFSSISSETLCGEIQRVEVRLQNVGNAPLTNAYIVSTDAKLYSLEDRDISFNNEQDSKKNKVTKISLPSSLLDVGETYKFPLWIRAPDETGNHKLDLLFYYENSTMKSLPKYRLCRHTWQFKVLDSVQISAIASKSGLFQDDSPTLNLIVRVKNKNDAHDRLKHSLTLTKISLQSNMWSIFSSSVSSSDIKINPQEVFHLMLKLRQKESEESEFSELSLIERDTETLSVTDTPYINFIQRRHMSRLDENENNYEMQQSSNLKDLEQNPLLTAMAIKSTLILQWRSIILDDKIIVREAVGQHHLDIEYLNKTYTSSEEVLIRPIEHSSGLKIFGPDRTVVSDVTYKKTTDPFLELEFQKNAISFSLNHMRETTHDFNKNRLCIVPVTMCIQNHLQLEITVKINTAGTSSQTPLPSIKSQLYSPQASTCFRYACHSAVYFHIEPLARRRIKLQALLSASGTYDLASRIEVDVKFVNNSEFIPQKWRMESICVINDDKI
ncbi:trafficking protein particle complex subunit 8 [Prorops nasuta]|uniref:trafficking protein particle complex subunit 8 n=1 Tax=Prorops nasuta TaxID=863751 RepID=UPI0034CDEF7E